MGKEGGGVSKGGRGCTEAFLAWGAEKSGDSEVAWGTVGGGEKSGASGIELRGFRGGGVGLSAGSGGIGGAGWKWMCHAGDEGAAWNEGHRSDCGGGTGFDFIYVGVELWRRLDGGGSRSIGSRGEAVNGGIIGVTCGGKAGFVNGESFERRTFCGRVSG